MAFPAKALFFLIIGITIQTAGAFTLSGIVNFTDVNGTIAPLPGAMVNVSPTINATTDGSGAYSISGLSGTYTALASKSKAFYMQSATTVISGDTTHNFNLLYSKGLLTTPILANNRITTQYSNNLRPINPWELPSFVWTATKYDQYIGTVNDKWYYITARYDGGNQFSTNNEAPEKGNYQIYFVSSDIYNNPTNGWHPTLNETRYFNSSTYYIQKGDVGVSGTHKSTATRESETKTSVWQVIPVFLMAIVMVIIMEQMAKRKHGQQRKNWNRRRR